MCSDQLDTKFFENLESHYIMLLITSTLRNLLCSEFETLFIFDQFDWTLNFNASEVLTIYSAPTLGINHPQTQTRTEFWKLENLTLTLFNAGVFYSTSVRGEGSDLTPLELNC